MLWLGLAPVESGAAGTTLQASAQPRAQIVARHEGRSLQIDRTPVSAAAPARERVGRVSGVITDLESGAPVPGAQVAVQGLPLGNVADDLGTYFINRVPVGGRTFRVEVLGYATRTATLNVAAGAENRLDVALAPSPLALAEVVVEEEGAGDLTARVDATPEPRLPAPALRPVPIREPDTTLMIEWRRAMRDMAALHAIEYPDTRIRVFYVRPAQKRVGRPAAVTRKDPASSRPSRPREAPGSPAAPAESVEGGVVPHR